MSGVDFRLLAEEVEAEEGFRKSVYQDHLGFWTIGIGRMVDARKGGGLTKDEALMLLTNDLTRVYNELRAALPWFDGLSDVRKRALVNMGFQMGVGRAPKGNQKGTGLLNFTTTLGLMEKGRFNEASRQMMDSLWARQTPARAGRMADMIRRG